MNTHRSLMFLMLLVYNWCNVFGYKVSHTLGYVKAKSDKHGTEVQLTDNGLDVFVSNYQVEHHPLVRHPHIGVSDHHFYSLDVSQRSKIDAHEQSSNTSESSSSISDTSDASGTSDLSDSSSTSFSSDTSSASGTSDTPLQEINDDDVTVVRKKPPTQKPIVLNEKLVERVADLVKRVLNRTFYYEVEVLTDDELKNTLKNYFGSESGDGSAVSSEDDNSSRYDSHSGEEPVRFGDTSDYSGESSGDFVNHPIKGWKAAFGKFWRKRHMVNLKNVSDFEHHFEKRNVQIDEQLWKRKIHEHLPPIEDDYGDDDEYAGCPHEFDIGIWNPGSLHGHSSHPKEHEFKQNNENGWKRKIHEHLPPIEDDYGDDDEYAGCPHEFDIGIWNPGSLHGHSSHPKEHEFKQNNENGWKRKIHEHLPPIEDDYGDDDEYAGCPHEFDIGIWNPGSLHGHSSHPKEHEFKQNNENGWKRKIHEHLPPIEDDYGDDDEYAGCPHEFDIGIWNPGSLHGHSSHPKEHSFKENNNDGGWKRNIRYNNENNKYNNNNNYNGNNNYNSNNHNAGEGEDGYSRCPHDEFDSNSWKPDNAGSNHNYPDEHGYGEGENNFAGGYYDKRRKISKHTPRVKKSHKCRRKNHVQHQKTHLRSSNHHSPYRLEKSIMCYHKKRMELCRRKAAEKTAALKKKCRRRSAIGLWKPNSMHQQNFHSEEFNNNNRYGAHHYPDHRDGEKRFRCKNPMVLNNGMHWQRRNHSAVHNQFNDTRRSNVTTIADTEEEVGDDANVSGDDDDDVSSAAGKVRGFAKLPSIPHTNPNGLWTPEPNDMPLPEPETPPEEEVHFSTPHHKQGPAKSREHNGMLEIQPNSKAMQNTSVVDPTRVLLGGGQPNSAISGLLANITSQDDPPTNLPSAFQVPGGGEDKEKESFKEDDKEDDKESQQTDEEKKINAKFPMMKFKVGMWKPGSIGPTEDEDKDDHNQAPPEGGKADYHEGDKNEHHGDKDASNYHKDDKDDGDNEENKNYDEKSPHNKENVTDEAGPNKDESYDKKNRTNSINPQAVQKIGAVGEEPEDYDDDDNNNDDGYNEKPRHNNHRNSSVASFIQTTRTEVELNAEVDATGRNNITVAAENYDDDGDDVENDRSVKQPTIVKPVSLIQNNVTLGERVANQTRSNVSEAQSSWPDYGDDYDDDGDDRDKEGGEYSKFHTKFPVGMWKPGSKTPDDFDYDDGNNGNNHKNNKNYNRTIVKHVRKNVVQKDSNGIISSQLGFHTLERHSNKSMRDNVLQEEGTDFEEYDNTDEKREYDEFLERIAKLDKEKKSSGKAKIKNGVKNYNRSIIEEAKTESKNKGTPEVDSPATKDKVLKAKKETHKDSNLSEDIIAYEDDNDEGHEGDGGDNHPFGNMPHAFPVGMWKPGSQTPDDFDYGDKEPPKGGGGGGGGGGDEHADHNGGEHHHDNDHEKQSYHDDHEEHRPHHEEGHSHDNYDEPRPYHGHDHEDHRPCDTRHYHDNDDEPRPCHHNEHDEPRPYHEGNGEHHPYHDNNEEHRPYHENHDEPQNYHENNHDEPRPYHENHEHHSEPCRENHDEPCNYHENHEHHEEPQQYHDENGPLVHPCDDAFRPCDDNVSPYHAHIDDIGPGDFEGPRPYHGHSRENKERYNDRGGYDRSIKSSSHKGKHKRSIDDTDRSESKSGKSHVHHRKSASKKRSMPAHKKKFVMIGKPKSVIPERENISGNASRRSWFHPMHFGGSILEKYKKHWANLENGIDDDQDDGDEKDEEDMESHKPTKIKPMVHPHVHKSVSHLVPDLNAQRLVHHRHIKHIDRKFSIRDKDAGQVPEEIMRTLNFPKKIYPGEASLPPLSASGDDLSEYTYDDKSIGSGTASTITPEQKRVTSRKVTKVEDPNEKRVFPVDAGTEQTEKATPASKDSIENPERKHRHKHHHHSTSERRRLHDYDGDNDFENERLDKDDGDDDDDVNKDEIERNIERKEKEIQMERLRKFKNRERNHGLEEFGEEEKLERKSGESDEGDDDMIREMEEKERKNTHMLHHQKRKRVHDRGEDRYNMDNEDDGEDDREGNYRAKPYRGLVPPHHGKEKFGRKNEEITINDKTREGNIDQLDVESRLAEGNSNVPGQDIQEEERLSDLDRSFSPYDKNSNKGKGRSDHVLRHMYGMDKEEDSPIRSHHHKMIDDSEENEEQIADEPSRKRYHDRNDDRERENENEDGGDEEEDLLKEKLYQEIRERERAMRDNEFRDDDQQGAEEEDEIPEREKSSFNDEKRLRKHYADDDDNYVDDDAKKRFLNRLSGLTRKFKAVQRLQRRPLPDAKEYGVLHAERVLDHLQDEAMDNQKKLNFQQTSGMISNKGGISLFMNKLNERQPKHEKMKRHELFLAPHRRNFKVKNTNTTGYTTVTSLLEEKSKTKTDKSRQSRTVNKVKNIAKEENEPNRRELVFKTFFSSKSKPLIRRYRLYSKRDTIIHPYIRPSGFKRRASTQELAFDGEMLRHFDPDLIR